MKGICCEKGYMDRRGIFSPGYRFIRLFIPALFQLTAFLLSCFISFAQLPPIGQWREHLSYHSATAVAYSASSIYASTPFSFFAVDLSENSVSRYSRITGLSETGVQAICFDEPTEKLLVAYTNSNIDILYRNDVVNIPDIKRDNVVGDKTIYSIFPSNGDFFLSTGIGVIVINGEKYEVKNTWFIGNGGNKIRVNGFTSNAGYYYAATVEGLKRTPVSGDPANYLNWEILSGSAGLSTGECSDVMKLNTAVVVLKNDSLFFFNGNSWDLFFNEPGWSIVNANVSAGKLILSLNSAPGSGKVVVLNPDGSVSTVIENPSFISDPRMAMFKDNNYWIADQVKGLVKYNGITFEKYIPNSPASVALGEISSQNKIIYAAAGSVNENWIAQLNKNGFFKYENGQWENYGRANFPFFDSIPDIITLGIEEVDGSVWAGSFGGGLLHLRTGTDFSVYKLNSLISESTIDPGSYRVAGLCFDKDRNLWISNYGALQPLVIRKNDGTWRNFEVPFALNENAVASILIDEFNHKWIVSPKGNGLIVFDYGNSIDDISDDKWKLLRMGAGLGNLPSNNVLSIAVDRDGFIWTGTDDGIGIFQCPGNVFSSTGCDAYLPVVQQGGFNSYLFKGEQVSSIAVDGANRKWIATSNGAWLIDAGGTKVLSHFTEENSFLLSNDVGSITIEGKTGEVFFATSKGICSFRGEATQGQPANENVLVFPNPVPPGYPGTIAIKGLVHDAMVKITELDGRLVYQARALGGQAIWDGRNYQGKKISSGVYLVLVTDKNRKENFVTRIIFISQ